MKAVYIAVGISLCALPFVAQAADDKLTTSVEFLAQAGTTTTNEDGIYYTVGGETTFESKIYPSSFWGTFPLYHQGTTMSFGVTLTNTATQGKKYRVRVTAISNVLNIDGTLGPEIGATQSWIVESLLPTQHITLTGSVNIGSIPSGLDVTRIFIAHLTNDPKDDDKPAGLADVKICVWCPPPARVASN